MMKNMFAHLEGLKTIDCPHCDRATVKIALAVTVAGRRAAPGFRAGQARADG
jgi:hypothetical protein